MERALLIILLHVSLLFPAFVCNKAPANFIFGDSIFDAGNNHYIRNCSAQADFPPYGSAFFGHPTGRFTNGRTVADFISQFSGIPLQKPFLEVMLEVGRRNGANLPSNGINFASAGSGVLPATNNHMGVTSLQAQLQQFQSMIQLSLLPEGLLQESLFLLESGSNDIFTYFSPFNTPPLSPDSHVKSMATQIAGFLDTIYSLGARKIAIFGLGPMGCVPARALLPGVPIDKCYGKMNKMAKDYNMALENAVNQFRVSSSGAAAVYGDVYKIVHGFKANPQRYGFKDVESACYGYGRLGGQVQCGKEDYTLCQDPNNYLFWDFFHPTEHTNELLSKALWAGHSTWIRPVNMSTLSNMALPLL